MTITVTAAELAGIFLLLQYATPLVVEAQGALGIL
jgi:hypothetical protein